MTLSYYIVNHLKLFNDDGTERVVRQQELDFMKMVAKAYELGCDLKLVRMKDLVIWTLEKSHNYMQVATPMLDRILVKPDKAEEKIGAYDVPQDAQKIPKRGKVIAVGPGRHAEETGVLIPMHATVGDTILYSKFGGTEVELNGETYVVLKPDECLLIL